MSDRRTDGRTDNANRYYRWSPYCGRPANKCENMALYRWTGDGRYSPPTKDSVQNMKNASVTYDNGTLTLIFQRARNTSDDRDWAFTATNCYYFIFPVGGGPHNDMRIEKHTKTPIISTEKICIGK